MVSIGATSSSRVARASVGDADSPVGPGVRLYAGSSTTARGSSRPSVNAVSTSSAIDTFTTDADTAGRSASTS